MNQVLAALGIILWLPCAVLRVLLLVIGWFFVPLTLVAAGARNTPPLWRPVYGDIADAPAQYRANRWKSYVWMAWRNPTGGLMGFPQFKLPEPRPNPDQMVRNENRLAASRWMQNSIFWEYWYIRQIDWTIPEWVPKLGGKQYKWFEFRIGWKFSDGEESFLPVIQSGPRSS